VGGISHKAEILDAPRVAPDVDYAAATTVAECLQNAILAFHEGDHIWEVVIRKVHEFFFFSFEMLKRVVAPSQRQE